MYRGRFAPSPTGPLHAGSLVAALASWLDAKANRGQWLVRIEDVDTPRCVPGAAEHILWQLSRCGLVSDEPVIWQSQRSTAYAAALQQLQTQNLVYPCTCSRAKIARHFEELGVAQERFAALPYPGFCSKSSTADSKTPAWRLRTSPTEVTQAFLKPYQPLVHSLIQFDATEIIVNWTDQNLGPQTQNLGQSVGDFILKRADGLWAYQLAVVVDDAAQGITHVVRGQDLADNTARQIWLQRCLGLPTPCYHHTPLVLAKDGQKLSKQNGAAALQLQTETQVLAALHHACATLGLQTCTGKTSADLLANAVEAWRTKALPYTRRP